MSHHIERLAQSDYDVGKVCDDIRRAGPDARVCYDTETGTPPGLEKVFKKPEVLPYIGTYCTGFSVCIAHPSTWFNTDNPELTGFYIPLGHERGNVSQRARANLANALAETAAWHVNHNMPFDCAMLMNEGLLFEVPRRALDTQIKRWLQDENGVKGLKEMGEMWLGEDASAEKHALEAIMAAPYSKITDSVNAVLAAYPELGYYKIKGEQVPYDGREGKKLHPTPEARAMADRLRVGRRWGQLTVEELYPYAARDSTLTAEIDHLLDGKSPAATIEREMQVNAICIDMTRRGISVDLDQLYLAAATYGAREEELRRELLEVHGLENPASSPQVAALLFDRLGLPITGRTKDGAPSTDKNALEQLAGDPVAKLILECRQMGKARSAYAEPFARFAEHSPDGRIHGQYGTTRTVTGRLAANGPNVMTIPKEESLPEVRAAFMLDPRDGIERLGFDIVSAELWITASYTEDPVLTEILLEGRNMHTEMMVQVFGGEPDKHRREYTLSKNVNYGIEYGAGLDQITIFAAKAGYEPLEARRVAEVARNGHKKMFKVQHARAEWLSKKADELGKIPLCSPGRYRHFRSPGKRVPGYTALNAIVQGSQAEFVKNVMIELYKRGYGELLTLMVHDELVFDCPTADHMEQELLEVLNKISLDINPFKFPLTWDAKAWSLAAAQS